jgi:hypothetical protein
MLSKKSAERSTVFDVAGHFFIKYTLRIEIFVMLPLFSLETLTARLI